MTWSRAIALGIGVRLVAGVDDRPASGRGRADPLPDVLGALSDRVHRTPSGLQHLAGPGEDLPADEERDQHLGVVAEIIGPASEVVLVTAVAVAGRVGVVLEEIDRAADPLLPQPLLGRDEQALEDALAGLVVNHQVVQRVAFRRGVLGVRADVEVQPCPVLQEHVAAAAPRHHSAEQVSSDLVGAEPALAAQGAGDAVFVLEAVDAALHAGNVAQYADDCSSIRRCVEIAMSCRGGPGPPMAGAGA